MTNNFAIVVDSSADIPEKIMEKYDIYCVPTRIIIKEKEYLDRIDISLDEIIHKLKTSDEKITTTQPLPMDFNNVFKEALEKYEKILSLSLTTKLSATYQNAVIAAKKVDKEKIICIDTLSITHGLGLLAQHAALCREQGMEIDQVAAEINEMLGNIKIYFLVDTLDYLHRGGRIGKAKHLIGSLLNMKPLLKLENGEIDAHKSVRGIETGLEEMKQLMKDCAKEYKHYALGVTFGERNPLFKELAKTLREEIQPLNYVEGALSPAVLCHTGPHVEAFILVKIPEKAIGVYK